MNNKKKILCLIMLSLITPLVVAQEAYFGVSIDCLESCKDGTVDISKPIMLKLEIKNNFDYWISLGTSKDYGSPDLRIIAENSNLKDGKSVKMHSAVLGGPFFLKPKTTRTIYLPFDTYNELDEDKRLGEWKVTPEFLPGEVKYFGSPYDGKLINVISKYKIPFTFKGNILKFEPKKEEVEVKPNGNAVTKTKDSVKGFFEKWGGYIIAGIIIGIVVGIFLFFLYLFKKKK